MGAPRRTLMRWTVSSSLRYRYLVVALGALTMAIGLLTLPSNRVDVFPEFAPPRVVIQTACLGLSTSDVEQLVTVPLEQAFNGVDGLDDMRSKRSSWRWRSGPESRPLRSWPSSFRRLRGPVLLRPRCVRIAPRVRWRCDCPSLFPAGGTE